jgi:hypothetical protein
VKTVFLPFVLALGIGTFIGFAALATAFAMQRLHPAVFLTVMSPKVPLGVPRRGRQFWTNNQNSMLDTKRTFP